jgi:hypothetical protein
MNTLESLVESETAYSSFSRATCHILSARHVIRCRRRYETVQLRDCIPEILFINAHDGRTATQFRLALYRPICTNGLAVCDETLPAWRVPHRGNILEQVIAAALAQAGQFEAAGAYVERMERTPLAPEQCLAFAADAIALRFPKARPDHLEPAAVLEPRRPEETGHDLWTTYNVIQSRGATHNCTYVELPFTWSKALNSCRPEILRAICST